MAFQNTKGRYASFGVATSISPEIIDSFWRIIDDYLKGVFPLDNVLFFRILKNKENKVSIEYSNRQKSLRIVFDFLFQYDPFLPKTVYILDNKGIETILLSHEIS